jgi:predicted amidophosphoribosyltransferase
MASENNTWETVCPGCGFPSKNIPKQADMVASCPDCGEDFETHVEVTDGVETWSLVPATMTFNLLMSRLFESAPGLDSFDDDEENGDDS